MIDLNNARCVAAALAVMVVSSPAWADEQPSDLTQLSLEELAEIQVTSVARRPQSLAEAAAAVFVITREDIRRSGATSLPEVLRLAPNLQVQRVNSADYAISARGFNGFETANKLLVMIDGRSVYTTLFSGVLWDAQGLVLEDIERIEVISGPGGALYGANAVNGVINITTRSAFETAGPALAVAAGTDEGVLSFRMGGSAGADAAWRAYVTGFDRGESYFPSGGGAGDEAAGARAGFRIDGTRGRSGWTAQGEAFRNDVVGGRLSGGHLSATWRRTLSGGGEVRAQAYYDDARRLSDDADETVQTADLSLQHTFTTGRHAVVWGGGLREVRNSLHATPGAPAFLDPAERRITLSNLFVQDQIALAPALTLTLGAKLENDSFAGAEFLPNARLAWRAPGGDLYWAAVSRAARTPNRIEQDFVIPGLLIAEDFEREQVVAYEAGFRTAPRTLFSLSVSAFYNDYEGLRTVTIHPVTVFPLRFANGGEGHSWGLEAWGSYDLTPRWRLSAGGAYLEKSFEVSPGEVDISNLASVGDDPRFHGFVEAHGWLSDAVDLSLRVRAADDLPVSGIDGYVQADARLSWHLSNGLELALTGRNLLDDRYVETGDPARRRAFGRNATILLRVGF